MPHLLGVDSVQVFDRPPPDVGASLSPQEKAAAVEIGLNAAIVSMISGEPYILTVAPPENAAAEGAGLPFGLFTPLKHRTLEIGLRDWVHEQTGLELGYVEQLYTFGDRGRHARPADKGLHVVSIGYVALTRGRDAAANKPAKWEAWYDYFPWEDWRQGKPAVLSSEIEPRLIEWASAPVPPGGPPRAFARMDQVSICFGLSIPWDDEKALERYELMYEAGLVAEAAQDGRTAVQSWRALPPFGKPMTHDHRRIMATAMGRLRGKLKYRPVIFELMPESFTLFELQRVVEAILGSYLHKQNFRRLVEAGGLVEPTGSVSPSTGGRPARVYRFRKTVLLERPAPGVRVKVQNSVRTNSGL